MVDFQIWVAAQTEGVDYTCSAIDDSAKVFYVSGKNTVDFTFFFKVHRTFPLH